MIAASRRGVLAGAMALPAAASVKAAVTRAPSGTVLIYDPELETARKFALSAEARSEPSLAVEGDRIRFARQVLARRPALVVGVTRAADALLIEEVAREAGYVPVAPPKGLGPAGWALAPR
ncbi:hypothetical protein [Tsuneonella sp. HG222]